MKRVTLGVPLMLRYKTRRPSRVCFQLIVPEFAVARPMWVAISILSACFATLPETRLIYGDKLSEHVIEFRKARERNVVTNLSILSP
jgi:hypothetical protein